MARVQLTRIEQLDRRYPEKQIELNVGRMLDAGAGGQRICAWLLEVTGERIPPSDVSSYKQRRWLAEQRRIRERVETCEALLKVIGKHGISNVTQAEIYRIVDEALRNHAKIDPQFALKEQRLWAEHELKREQLEQLKRDLEFKVEKLEREYASKRQEIAEVVRDEQAAAEDIRRRIREIYGLYDAPAGGAAAAVSGEVGTR
jgi:hypothetical protein